MFAINFHVQTFNSRLNFCCYACLKKCRLLNDDKFVKYVGRRYPHSALTQSNDLVDYRHDANLMAGLL